MNMTGIKITGIILLVLAITIFGIVWTRNRIGAGVPIVFSDKSMLAVLWTDYKTNYVDSSGRAINTEQGDETTSEGESYSMLRAVWMDDKPTFDLTYNWTKANLARKGDHLSSWLYGKEATTTSRSSDTYGVLTDQGGYNSATDADTDIALSLIFAANRWDQPSYLSDAKLIVADIWSKDVVTINGTPYLTADDLEKTSSAEPLIDPSYFEPYAYRIFATIDTNPKDDWLALASSSYAILNETADQNLDTQTSAGLPPDWIKISRVNGSISAVGTSSLTTNFGYDAMRVPFRIALDYQWNQAPEAKAYLQKLSFLSEEWTKNKSIASTYTHAGDVVSSQEVPAMYGGTIGYFMVNDPKDAPNVYSEKLKFLFSEDNETWKEALSYYDANWAWFGMALYDGLLPNLSKK